MIDGNQPATRLAQGGDSLDSGPAQAENRLGPDMPLPPGRRLGPYELVSLIGAGGMGEVYRARDTRLGREVAVKIIASDGASNPDRLGRFEQEARAVAALDDPHILSIHDLGQEDGTTFAVFELLDGETLQQRLERGALTPRKAVEWTIQICRGLAAAHARGIVHRDLKPANLFVTRDGRIKILDFGLAKLNEAATPGADGENTPTRTATEKGMVLGTVGYMSPEQVRGQPADERSDLFAVGATLYEMLAGRPAFEGKTSADKLSAILNREPPEIVGPGEPVPAPLGRIVHRCLEKDPEERFQSARDVVFALEAIGLGSRAGTEPVETTPRPRSRGWRAALVGATLLGLGAALGLAYGPKLWERPLPRIQQLTFRQGVVDHARFTSDGRTVVYSAYWDGKPPEVFSTRLESRESRSLGLPPARVMAVSSRGELAILLTRPVDLNAQSTGTLARVSLSGGEPRQVLENVMFADWSPDGRELAVLRHVEGGVYQLEYPIGTPILRSPYADSFRISPRGDKVAVAGGGLRIYDRAGRQIATPAVPASTAGLAWDGDDALWVLTGESQTTRSLWRATLDGKAKEVYRALGLMGILHDASPDGRILVHHGFERFGVKAKPPGEARERELGVFNWSGVSGLSDDGSRLLVRDVSFGAGTFSYLRSADGSPPVNLADGDALALSPDGSQALVAVPPAGLPLTLVPTGPGESRRLPTEGLEGVRFAFFVDNEQAVVMAATKGGQPRAFLFPLTGGAPKPITPEGTAAVAGSFAAGTVLGWSWGNGALARIPIAGGEPRALPGSVLLPTHPIRVSADGRSLFVGDGGVPANIDRMDLATGKRSRWKSLLPEEPAGVVIIESIHLTPDGDGYAYSYGRFLQDLFLLDGLRP